MAEILTNFVSLPDPLNEINNNIEVDSFSNFRVFRVNLQFSVRIQMYTLL